MANHINWQGKSEFSVGDTIKVHQTVKEGDKTRTQLFQGIVIAIRGDMERKNFIVRKIATGGIGIERIFPANSPTVTGIEIVKKGKVRRAKLYYLRDLLGKKATKIKDVFVKKAGVVLSDNPILEVESKEEKREEKSAEGTIKVKNAPKAEAPIKEKKIKKGPKKIVRKEKVFVR